MIVSKCEHCGELHTEDERCPYVASSCSPDAKSAGNLGRSPAALLPCPFCGWDSVYVNQGNAVDCECCGATGPYPSETQIENSGKELDELTVELWNRRAGQPSDAGAVSTGPELE